MLVPIQLPPGQFRNGTDLQSSGRWRDGNLVRWRDGAMQPIGGWRERAVAQMPEVPRTARAWRDNSGDQWLAVGSFDALEVFRASGDNFDLTPTDLAEGLKDASQNTGFGGGFYGENNYGVQTIASGTFQPATTWSMDNWGENLVACSIEDGRLLEWDLVTTEKAAPIANAPANCTGLMVTEERFLFALGAGGNPRKVQWSNREDNTEWDPTATNEAGDIELQTNGQIMCGGRVRGQALIVTNIDAHAATYLPGSLFVYGFERVGTSCGIISRQAMVSIDEGAFWMGRGGFFTYQGGAVQEIPCEVSDYVFRRINNSQESKIWAVENPEFNEIWWFYPSGSECDEYVCYNYRDQFWTTGSLPRTAGVPRGVYPNPVWFGADGTVYDHEVGINHNGSSPFCETGPISVQNGDFTFSAMQLIPDELTQGDVRAVFKTRYYPNAPESEHGPYHMGEPTSVRFTGRQFRMRVETDRLSDWRVGTMRLQVNKRGRR